MNVNVIQPVQQKEIPPYVWHGRLFSPPECDALIQIGEGKVLNDARIGNGIDGQTELNKSYRCVKDCAIEPKDAPWAYERLRDRVAASNYDYFRYDIHGFHEHLIFLRYDFDPELPGKYEWHQDIGGGMSSLRKLSTVTQLSNPSEYEGCRLNMFTNMQFDPNKVERGDTIIFPSYLPHCVTPITNGRRYALVSWVTGPQFR